MKQSETVEISSKITLRPHACPVTYVAHNWIIYVILSVFDSYRDAIVIVISMLLSIMIVTVLLSLSSKHDNLSALNS